MSASQRPALFVSDLHLHPSRSETASRFRDFLAGPAKNAQSVYILGDLFDAWAGDDDLDDPFNAIVAGGLRTLADREITVFLLPGNRDFLVDRRFAATAGVTLLSDETVIDLAGTPTLLLHGDTLCTDDREYQAFRQKVRSNDWRRDFLAQPLATRKAEVERLRGLSESQKRVKPMDLMDVSSAAVEQAFVRHGVTRMIHGHTHRQARHTRTVEGRPCERWVLPDWDTGPQALACDDGGCTWLPLTA